MALSIKENDVFGKLTVLQKLDLQGKNVMYLVECECGTMKSVQASQLTSGSTKSCGCLLTEKRGSPAEKHGMRYTKEYSIWSGIVTRTQTDNYSTREWYFDKNIGMSSEWRSSFVKFYEDMGPCPEGYSIDRIDPSKGYCKENCRWASRELQSINKSVFKNNTSGTKGVSFNKKDNRWVAYIYYKNKRFHLGSFVSYEDAVAARKVAEEKFWSHIKE